MNNFYKYELLKDMQNVLAEYDGDITKIDFNDDEIKIIFVSDWGDITFNACFKE